MTTAAALAVILVAAWMAYLPGLSGGFLFDDYVNLDALGRYGVVDNWPVFWRYVTSGTADPLGRPVALLSFLLDARNWPAPPGPFLRTNLVIHLTNGVLLFFLLKQLGRRLHETDLSRADATALLAAGAWLLHPLFVSTTLYAVQRQAMLPATFTLLGLVAYSAGRLQLDRSGGTRGAALMVSGLIIGTLLATLSKANGILLPLLAGVLELCIFQPTSRLGATPFRLRMAYASMVACALAVAFLVAKPLLHLNVEIPNRPWTIGERILTEPRVLLDYLELLVVPRSVSTGLFNDAYPVSTGLLDPWTTLPSILIVLVLVSLAWMGRRKRPVFSTGVLFFFVGHLLESTSIPLELYFEHRNYLPAMLLFWPAAEALTAWKRPTVLKYAVGLAVLLLLAGTTWQRSTLWGQPAKLAELWALANPTSARAQASAAIGEISSDHADLAHARLAREWNRHPNDLQIAFNVIDASCSLGMLAPAESERLARSLAQTSIGALMMTQWLERSVEVAHAQACPGLDFAVVESWVDAAQSNPGVGADARKSEDLDPVRALMALRKGNADLALVYFNRALKAHPTPDGAARNVVAMASAGQYRQALAHLDFFESLPPADARNGLTMRDLHQQVLEWQGYWPRELAILRSKLRAELAKEAQ